jgi:eukaryotic-like serine/threonine-protein kinase
MANPQSLIGQTISHYRILAQLGSGGMGVVYRAEDLNLKREVAIKVLPDAFARDPQRLARFEREAHLLASLNNPNIASIYGLEKSDGSNLLVLELVPGETLDQRLVRGPLETEEALHLAFQICEGLEAAHEKGVIHRDLKPSNIKVTPEGKVKLLDFGLAKALAAEAKQTDIDSSPTETAGRTHAGVILGTAAYMSPEQARGKLLDKRSDIWSFGCVLFECLTGRRAFHGETVTDALAAIVQREPNWAALPADTPAAIRELLRRCLQKDRNLRLHDIADARIEIGEALDAGPQAITPAIPERIAGSRWRLALAGVACALLGSMLTWIAFHPRGGSVAGVPKLLGVTRLTHDPDLSEWPTWSPDSSLIAFASNRNGNYEIYVRRVEGGQEVNVTNDPGQDIQPAFSPDGNSIAFVSTRSSRTGLVKIGSTFASELRVYGGDIWVEPALGGQARLLAKDGNFPAWDPSSRQVIFVSGREQHRSILAVPADGGSPSPRLASQDSAWEITRISYSPNGRWITFETDDRSVFIFAASGGPPRKLLYGFSHVWDPSGKRLYFCTREARGGSGIHSVEIDEGTGRLVGEPQTVAVMMGTVSDLAISRDGRSLALSELEGSLNLSRLPLNSAGDSPSGPEEILSKGQVFDRQPQVSPDGRNIAYASNRLGADELWVFHIDASRNDRVQLPGRDAAVDGPHWFPDGRRLVLARSLPDGTGSLWIVAADGSSAEKIAAPAEILWAEGSPVSPDGRGVLYAARVNGYYQMFKLDVDTRQAHQLTFTADDKFNAVWSPDRRSLVYTSNASGAIQLWNISLAGGKPERLTQGEDRIRHMSFSGDGRWLYFQPNHLNIYRMPANGGPVQQVTHFPEAGLFMEEPTISPDSRYLVYCRFHGGSSLWLLSIASAGSASK